MKCLYRRASHFKILIQISQYLRNKLKQKSFHCTFSCVFLFLIYRDHSKIQQLLILTPLTSPLHCLTSVESLALTSPPSISLMLKVSGLQQSLLCRRRDVCGQKYHRYIVKVLSTEASFFQQLVAEKSNRVSLLVVLGHL